MTSIVTTATVANRRELYPEIDPYFTGFLSVGRPELKLNQMVHAFETLD